MSKPKHFRCTSIILCLISIAVHVAAVAATPNAGVVERVGADIRYLSSDELGGRGTGSAGLKKAAVFIEQRFRTLGLASPGKTSEFTRPFEMAVDTRVVPEKTSLVLHGPNDRILKLKVAEDFRPLATGGSGHADASIVFAGYGISAPKLKYDDYRDRDIAGKVVLIIRREPQQDDDASVFQGKRTTGYASIRSKIRAAKKAGAVAVLLVNDPFTTDTKHGDVLAWVTSFGTKSQEMPFAHLKQSVVDEMLNESPLTTGEDVLDNLHAVSKTIDATLTPLTQPLIGWSAELQFTFETVNADVSNVIGVLEGEGPLADQTVVVGAHYDHIGYGPRGSKRPEVHAVHNGADDNASGTAALLELARRFAQRDHKLARRLVFIAFTAEERGLVGSRHYTDDPIYPLDKTIAMVNLDMLGHLKDNQLFVGGADSAKEFSSILERVREDDTPVWSPMKVVGNSDHAPFYRKNIPVLFFFTGLHDYYHTPDDDFETLDINGETRILDLAESVVDAVVSMPNRPTFVPAKTAAKR